MPYIEFQNIDKYYDGQQVLKNFNLSINQGDFVTLLGPSGCGKSTLLRCFAGLETIQDGKIFLDNEDITTQNSSQRNVGMIFQQYSLFPTMNVYNNIAFGLKMKKLPKAVIHANVTEALNMVNLKGSEKKFPSQLSGGEQQRVALARCIVTKPKVLLLDEPFSAIDAKLRKALQFRIKEIHRELNITSIFVTHDQDEAMTMSDVIHVMNNGVIEQSGKPMELYSNPKSEFVASFIGNYNMIDSEVFSVIAQKKYSNNIVAIRPESIDISKEFKKPSTENEEDILHLNGVICDVITQGSTIRYYVKVKETLIKVDTIFNSDIVMKRNEEVNLYVHEKDMIFYNH